MPSFSLVIQYVTGYAVATDPASRELAEWPPHPARVYMALVAAHFEAEGEPAEKAAEREALGWLASLGPPALSVPAGAHRDVLSVYVPVNDQKGGDALAKRSRQPRSFPRVYVGDEPCRLIWDIDSSRSPEQVAAIERLSQKVTRIGHSSSLVWVRTELDGDYDPNLVPDDSGLGVRIRTSFPSMLDQLVALYAHDARQRHDDMLTEISRLGQEIKAISGKGATHRKEPLKSRLEKLKELTKCPPRGPLRPVISHTTSYRPVVVESISVSPSPFDPNFVVLREHEDSYQTLGLESTAQIMAAMRGLLIKEAGGKNAPAWVTGHEPDGSPLRSSLHLAIVPLAFVGRPWFESEQYADGHLMGLALLVPRSVPPRERARVLAPLLFDYQTNEPMMRTLTIGRAGVWDVVRDNGIVSRVTLRPATYCQASHSWASVTPVLLDRMPKSNRVADPLAWREEVARIVASSCDRFFEHVGESDRPRPMSIRVEKTPFFLGSLRAMPGQGGFPQLRHDKFQVHVQIDFDREVEGPLLLGAGRFQGYGLMRPWEQPNK